MDRPSSGSDGNDGRLDAAARVPAPRADATDVGGDAVGGSPAGHSPDARSSARPQSEPRQRWRITFARDEIRGDRAGRIVLEEWHDALRASGLPIATQDGDANRPKLAFAAPLPASAVGEAELVDIWLLERLPLWRLRENLAARLPTGHRWLAGEDVWLGAPPLPGQVSAAEWRILIEPLAGFAPAVEDAARALLSAAAVPRSREKGGVTRTFDLRPLVGHVALEVAAEPAAEDTLRIVTRFDPALGTGRPEDIVAALADGAGVGIEIRSMVRERLILNEPSATAIASIPAGRGRGGSRR